MQKSRQAGLNQSEEQPTAKSELEPSMKSIGSFAITALLMVLPVSAMAAGLEVAADAATGGLGKFAVEEIRREAEARGLARGTPDDGAIRIAIDR